MNQHPPEKFIEHLRSIRLSSAERSAMRSALIGAMQKSRIRQPILSPWSRFFEAKRLQAAFLLAVIIIGYGSSATLAAEGALPGDMLYPVKTRVVEPLARLVAARSPVAKATFETRLLEKRLEEAETLETGKKLGPELERSVREVIRAQGRKAKAVARDADGELPLSVLRAATSTADRAASSSNRIFEKEIFEKLEKREREDSGERDKDKDRTQRAVRDVREKHKRILEKLDLSDERDDDSDGGKREDDD
jgi:ABC-type multidrug transport system fused ATPase/permease subunit